MEMCVCVPRPPAPGSGNCEIGCTVGQDALEQREEEGWSPPVGIQARYGLYAVADLIADGFPPRSSSLPALVEKKWDKC